MIGSLVRIFDANGLMHTEGILLSISRRKQSRQTNILTLTVRCPLSPARVSGMKVMVEYQEEGETQERRMILGGHTKVEGQVNSQLHASVDS
jgi:hypothetical protein